nr:MAG TPA: hypothetical protein [Bacteriophage sp.]
MEKNSIKKKISLDKLIVNSQNARFYNEENYIQNDIIGINSIINLNQDYVYNLCKNIAENGFRDIELPIVSPMKDNTGHYTGYYLVRDGNRRITSLKLLTIYKNDLDKFELSPSIKYKISNLSYSISMIDCSVSENEEYINKILENIHSGGEPGTNKINWSPQAKAQHNKNVHGIYDRQLSFTNLLNKLIDIPNTDNEKNIISIIKNGKWFSKMSRFLRRKELALLLGLYFDENNHILCYFKEKFLKNLLLEFFLQVNNAASSDIAQTNEAQNKFICKFILDYNIPEKIINNNYFNDICLFFDPNLKKFNATELPLSQKDFINNLYNFLRNNINEPNILINAQIDQLFEMDKKLSDFTLPINDKPQISNSPNINETQSNSSPSTNNESQISNSSSDTNKTQPNSLPSTNDESQISNSSSNTNKTQPNSLPSTNDESQISNSSSTTNKTQPNSTQKKRNPKLPKFFKTLTYVKVDPNDNKNTALISICEELIKLSKGRSDSLPYEKYPIASTILLRAFIEQCFKYLIRKSLPNIYSKLRNDEDGKDPTLHALIQQIKNKKKILFSQDKTGKYDEKKLIRIYSFMFDTSGVKDGLDLATHHGQNSILFLTETARNFSEIAMYILNTDLQKLDES